MIIIHLNFKIREYKWSTKELRCTLGCRIMIKLRTLNFLLSLDEYCHLSSSHAWGHTSQWLSSQQNQRAYARTDLYWKATPKTAFDLAEQWPFQSSALDSVCLGQERLDAYGSESAPLSQPRWRSGIVWLSAAASCQLGRKLPSALSEPK